MVTEKAKSQSCLPVRGVEETGRRREMERVSVVTEERKRRRRRRRKRRKMEG